MRLICSLVLLFSIRINAASYSFSWDVPASGPPSMYNLYAATFNGTNLVAMIPGTTTTYLWTPATNASYTVWVTAKTGLLESAPSNTIFLPVPPPDPPRNFRKNVSVASRSTVLEHGATALTK